MQKDFTVPSLQVNDLNVFLSLIFHILRSFDDTIIAYIRTCINMLNSQIYTYGFGKNVYIRTLE